ncbi:PH domain-containing protein [Chloroflexota bacterium]
MEKEDNRKAVVAENYGKSIFPKELLTTGEHMVLETRPVVWPKLIGSMIVLIVGIAFYISVPYLEKTIRYDNIPWDIVNWISIAILLLGMLSAVIRWFRWKYTFYGITNKRILRQRGIIANSYVDCSLGKIQNLYVDISILGKLFGYGTVRVASAATAGIELNWVDVKEPLKVQREINEAIEKYEKET